MIESRRKPMARYGVAIAAVLVATAARSAVEGWVSDRIPFATFFAAVAAVGLYGGLGPALLTTVLSAVIADFLFVPPHYALSLSAEDLTSMALFLAVGGLISLLAHRFQQTRERLIATARAREQQAFELQAERKRLADIIASIPGVVWEAWGEPDSSLQRINYVSEYVEPMLGYTQEEWTAGPNFWLQIVHPDDRDMAARVAGEKFAGGDIGENEFRWITRDGRTLWVVARSSTIKDESGTPVGMRGVTFDITQRKEVEERLALLAEISTTGLTALSFEDLATRIAQRTAQVVGEYCILRLMRHGRLEAVASAHAVAEAEPVIRAIAAESELEALYPAYAQVVETPRTTVANDLTESAFAHIDRSGMEELFEKYRARRKLLTPLISTGQVLGTLTIGRAGGPPYTTADGQFAEAIAARAALAFENARLVELARRDADEAREARAQAEAAGRAKDEFLATLSHELRTPLNAILGWAHMLRDPQLPPERRQSAVDTILRNAQSQEQLISDILDVQRIMAGKIRLNMRSVDLGNVVRAAAETVQPSADAKQVRLQLLLDLDVPPIAGDPDRLQQVVWNLLTNAIKFAPAGGHVHVRLLKSGDHCELIVEDNGPGINPDFIPHMFERFRQADSSTTRAHKGLGLGLAIVRSLVEMHGGTITASNVSAPGATGAVFAICLPRQTVQIPTANSIVDRQASWSGDLPSLTGVHVLVVEDDADARDLLTTVLQRCGAEVSVAASAADGMTALQTHRPDVVVSDIEMPEEDGYSFIRRVRALGSAEGGDIPAAALTAYASPSDRMKVLGAGYNIHVAKPVQPAELAVVVASLAGRRA
jgi:PAS domain S-box-containing protein